MERDGLMNNTSLVNGESISNYAVRNPHLAKLKSDFLYHIDMGTDTHDFQRLFGDVKFVCFGGKPLRMKTFATFLARELGLESNQEPLNFAKGAGRYALYKVGPVISVSHGIGISSIAVILHEIFKLLYHAACSDVTCIRIGSSGGIGIEPGTCVISNACVDGMMRDYFEIPILGRLVQRQSVVDDSTIKGLLKAAETLSNVPVTSGKTMCSLDFYEVLAMPRSSLSSIHTSPCWNSNYTGQARLDGALCEYGPEDKNAFLQRLKEEGVVNIEMEGLCFTALCHAVGLRAAVICVTFLDRLNNDQITATHDVLTEWELRPQRLVVQFIKNKLESL